jgi:hypothetical protein
MMTTPHLESLRAAQLHMTSLEKAWGVARKVNRESRTFNYEIPTPKSLLDAVASAPDFDSAADAWEAVNYYNEAFFLALQRIEDETFRAMVAFEVLANGSGYYVSSVVQTCRSYVYHARTNVSV